MFRSLIRSGVIALFVLVLSAPAQASPLSGDAGEGFTWSLSQIWEHLTSPLVELWTEDSRSICDPNGGGCMSGATAPTETLDSRSICDPNGGGCGS
jgi:hypothetical protein